MGFFAALRPSGRGHCGGPKAQSIGPETAVALATHLRSTLLRRDPGAVLTEGDTLRPGGPLLIGGAVAWLNRSSPEGVGRRNDSMGEVAGPFGEFSRRHG